MKTAALTKRSAYKGTDGVVNAAKTHLKIEIRKKFFLKNEICKNFYLES